MNVLTLFEKIVGKQQERSKQRAESYRELVAGTACGTEPEQEELEQVLAGAGKSLDDLQKAVELYQRRMELKAIVVALPKVEAERAQLREKIAAADREFEQAEQLHDDVTQPLYAKIRELNEAASEASDAKRDLFMTCDNTELIRQYDEVNAELRKLSEETHDQTSRVAYFDQKSLEERDQSGREIAAEDRQKRREQSEVFRKQVDMAKRKIKLIEKAQAELTKKRDQIEQRMREW